MILYNGASGGLGQHLPPALRQRELEGHALAARLEDREGLGRELSGLKPGGEDVVLLQLAARVSVPACEADPAGALKTNVADTCATVADFVGWAEARSLRPRVLYVSSGHVYAAQPAGVQLDESRSTAPRSAYARSKLQAEDELAALARRRGFGLCIARVFGLIAPGQPRNYVLPGLIGRVRELKLSGIPGLSYVRDYLDARDVCVDLLHLCAAGGREASKVELVNVCSGEGVTLRRILVEIIRTLRPAEELALLERLGEAPGRPDDVPSIVGSPARFVAITGHQPRRISLGETVRDACAAE